MISRPFKFTVPRPIEFLRSRPRCKSDHRRRQPAHQRRIETEELAAVLDGARDEEKHHAEQHADHRARSGAGGAQRPEHKGQRQQRHDDHGEKPARFATNSRSRTMRFRGCCAAGARCTRPARAASAVADPWPQDPGNPDSPSIAWSSRRPCRLRLRSFAETRSRHVVQAPTAGIGDRNARGALNRAQSRRPVQFEHRDAAEGPVDFAGLHPQYEIAVLHPGAARSRRN